MIELPLRLRHVIAENKGSESGQSALPAAGHEHSLKTIANI